MSSEYAVINRTVSEIVRDEVFQNKIWKRKYSKLHSVEEVISHVCTEVAKYVPDSYHGIVGSDSHTIDFATMFYNAIINGHMFPGGRIVAAFGQFIDNPNCKLTPMNCYCTAIHEDSLEGIIQQSLYWSAKIFAWGGGSGTDISALRPDGSSVNNAAITSTGAWSFMSLYDVVTERIGQRGRRGALKLDIHCAHPDVLHFVDTKLDKVSLQNMNISVKVSNEFMKAVEQNSDWDLWYPEISRSPIITVQEPPKIKEVQYIADCYNHPEYHAFHIQSDGSYRVRKVFSTIKARDLWNKIITNATKCAEPGVLFWDLIMQDGPYNYTRFPIHSTNPCGEEPLPADGACNLIAVNLARMVDPWSSNLNHDKLRYTVRLATIFADALNSLAIERKLYPFQSQIDIAEQLRLIGVGITGLGDALIQSKIRYDSDDALAFADSVCSIKEQECYITSILMAKESGSYPAFEYEKACYCGHLEQVLARNSSVADLFHEYKCLRNAQNSTVAPTGTISQLCACSTGIEPVTFLEFDRAVKEGDSRGVYKVKHWIVQDMIKIHGEDFLSHKSVVAAHDIDPIFRVRMQSVVQRYTDGSISSTVNLPADTTPETVDRIYTEAFKHKCKGITIYVDGTRDSVIKKSGDPQVCETSIQSLTTNEIDEILSGDRIRVPMNPKWYVRLSYWQGRPVECFIDAGKAGSNMKAMLEGYGRLISLYLREGGEVSKIVQELIDIRGKKTTFTNGWVIHSEPDAIAKALDKLLRHRFNGDGEVTYALSTCPVCHQDTYVNEGGCGYCMNDECGHSTCE